MLTFFRVNIATFGFLIVLRLIQIQECIPFLVSVLIVLILWFIVTTIGSFHIRWNYFLKAIHKNKDVNDNVIALTFDDGPNPEFTPEVLSLLKKYNFKATFFCIGKQVEKHPEILQQILADGHVVGNHSYLHSNNYGFLSTKKVISDLEKNQQIIENITSLKTQFFRPPFGVTNPNISKAVKKMNLITFGWSVRSYDTVVKNPTKVFQKISSKIQKGDVVLLHDTSQKSVLILEQLLEFMKQTKMKSVTLESLFNLKPYEA